MSKLTKAEARQRRHMRIRKKISGSAECPRMAVFVSNKHIYVQLIDDEEGNTITSTSTLSSEFKEKGENTNIKGAEALGKIAAEKAMNKGIKKVVFDRAGFKFHGKIKAVADSARNEGMKF